MASPSFTDRLGLTRPTLVVDQHRTQRNLAFMAEKAERLGVRLRPHFKTHQSAGVGAWFNAFKIDGIAVSSTEMGEYFCRHDWRDILIALPVNLREAKALNQLAGKCRLGVLFESDSVVEQLDGHLENNAQAWIKIDTGYHRTGLPWSDVESIVAVARRIQTSRHLELKGILAHAGHTYSAKAPAEIRRIWGELTARLADVREAIAVRTGVRVEISAGDTPGCMLAEDFGDVDEIRPGNYAFFDLMQSSLGVCTDSQIAVALAAPVLAVHPERSEVVVHGGAVHLSRESIPDDSGHPIFGKVALPGESTWGEPIPGAVVTRISQEHGILKTPESLLGALSPGDVVMILPPHSCLTVDAMGRMVSLDGEELRTAVNP